MVDAQAAVDAGVDAIGLNFVGGPRQIDTSQAGKILKCIGPLVTPVALVRLTNGRIAADLVQFLDKNRLSHLQLYGDVEPKSLARLINEGFRPIPVIQVKDDGFVEALEALQPGQADYKLPAVVLDAYNPVREGGTGTQFRWDWVANARESGKLSEWPPIILAGGLNPYNVAKAVRIVRPLAVDVSSGVEKDEAPGIKDTEKMRQFVRIAKSVDICNTTQ
jgi:phosphoribosylanthranilate isomerase